MNSLSVSLDSEVSVPDDPGFPTFMWNYYKNNNYTDICFELRCKDTQVIINAHRLMLSIWSPVFEDMLYGPFNQDNIIAFDDVNQEAFKDMLNYFYGVDPVLTSCEKAYELHKVAAKFEVVSLISLCQKFFSKVEVQVTNVFEIFEVAECMENRVLMGKCMKLIEDKTEEILSCYDCCNVSHSMIRILLRCPKLSLKSEYELLTWMFAWAKNKYHDNHKLSGTREILEEFLPQMHFQALTNVEFAEICRFKREFFDAKEAQSIFMNIAIHGSWPLPEWCDPEAKFRKYTGK